MDVTRSTTGAAERLRAAAARGYLRDDVVAALLDLAAERDFLLQAIAEGRERAAELGAAAISASALERDLAARWLDAEQEAARIRADADEAAAATVREAEVRAGAVVAAALRSAAGAVRP